MKILENLKVKSTETISKGFLLYFFDVEHLESELIPLTEIPSTIRLKKTQEVFELAEPAIFLSGKPVFFVVRGNPLSLTVDMAETQLKKKGYSASEIDARIESIYTNQLFRRKFVSKEWIFAWFLSILLTVTTTWMVAHNYFSLIVNSAEGGTP